MDDLLLNEDITKQIKTEAYEVLNPDGDLTLTDAEYYTLKSWCVSPDEASTE